MENLPGPAMYNNINTTKYTKASSFVANGSLAWITKNATHIVNIIGIIANRYKRPTINAIEQNNSPKIAKLKDMVLPTPKGSGNTADSSWKFVNF